jgi:predicted kinase
MKSNIRKILRENVNTNVLGITITRPNQELIVMVGIPGSGKSTKAKELVGNGQIFSTDDRIESQGDYLEFFNKMINSKDFTPLSNMHNLNFTMAKKAMKTGTTPVIIDNTNLSPSESKKYVEEALLLGYADDNIKFIEIGTGGLSAEELANRNTHGVPLDKIQSMIQKYNSHKPMTLNKVLNSKSIDNKKTNLIASLVLDDTSHDKLIKLVKDYIPKGWKVFAHHMTINFGNGLPENLKSDLGKVKSITATEIGVSDMAIAVRVEGYHSDNKIPHITIAVNVAEGGRPVMSNNITNWSKLENKINLSGVISEEKLN